MLSSCCSSVWKPASRVLLQLLIDVQQGNISSQTEAVADDYHMVLARVVVKMM